MNALTHIDNAVADALPALIDRAANALSGARSSAEVLEARDMARVAYDASRTAGRMARAKAAHDEVIGAVYRAQADAALIEARAKMRLADEYDAAQERGEVATREVNPGSVGHVGDDNMPPATASDLGLRRDEIHEARKLRNAEAADPGKAERAVNDMLERGEEPTKAALVYTHERSRKGPEHAARWARGIFRDIYPSDWPARNWGEAPPSSIDLSAFGLVEREVKRFRKNNRRAA